MVSRQHREEKRVFLQKQKEYRTKVKGQPLTYIVLRNTSVSYTELMVNEVKRNKKITVLIA
jgi:hypothetical protein